jgi:hypothetical protein
MLSTILFYASIFIFIIISLHVCALYGRNFQRVLPLQKVVQGLESQISIDNVVQAKDGLESQISIDNVVQAKDGLESQISMDHVVQAKDQLELVPGFNSSRNYALMYEHEVPLNRSYVNVSEESSMKINDIEQEIYILNNKVDDLHNTLQNIQYIDPQI